MIREEIYKWLFEGRRLRFAHTTNNAQAAIVSILYVPKKCYTEATVILLAHIVINLDRPN